MRHLLWAALCIASVPAYAADIALEPVPMVETVDPARWSGFYVGIQAGGAFDAETGVLGLPAAPTPPPFAAFGSNFYGSIDAGFTGGIHAGYDWQFGNFVVGAIADISATDFEEVQGGDSATPAVVQDADNLGHGAPA